MNPPPRILTRRLELVPADPDIVRAAMEGPAALGRALGAVTAAGWPPEFLDEAALRFTLDRLTSNPRQAGWWMHLVVLVRPDGASRDRTVIGSGGFCGPPTEEGTVEVGYSIVAEHQRRGYATEALAGLIGRAFEDPRVRRVVGDTLPELIASQKVMLACGMQPAGEGAEPGTIRFAIARE